MMDLMLSITRWTRSPNGKRFTMPTSFNVFSIEIIGELFDLS